MVLPCVVTPRGKIRRGNYVFLTWTGDHSPRHVHVYRDGRLVMKWNLDSDVLLAGKDDARIRSLIGELRAEGRL